LASLYEPGGTVTVRAVLLGERLDLKGLETTERLGLNPLVIPSGERQHAVLFRYGAAVLFGLSPLAEVGILQQLEPLVAQAYPKREVEDARITVANDADEEVAGGEIRLREVTVDHLQIIADVLAKSVVLGYYEASLAAVFDAVEPFAAGLGQRGRAVPRSRDLLRYIGETLLMQHKMVGRVEVGEKPDLLWERPALNRLHARLEDEYEVQERRLALERKLDLLSRTAETLTELLQNRRSLRVEWYIVALILIEIFLTLYQLFFRP
jgi:uncharacterized Rmd1/YagE family protein